MIILSNIDEQIQKKLVTFKKVNDAFAVVKKKFNPDTGVELESEEIAIDIKDLDKAKSDAQEIIVSCDKVITILNALK